MPTTAWHQHYNCMRTWLIILAVWDSRDAIPTFFGLWCVSNWRIWDQGWRNTWIFWGQMLWKHLQKKMTHALWETLDWCQWAVEILPMMLVRPNQCAQSSGIPFKGGHLFSSAIFGVARKPTLWTNNLMLDLMQPLSTLWMFGLERSKQHPRH